eukprot:TRINITY_DN1414_c0_g2_i15.p2 TRINITY_DN1414_c0_g2~~TRINITY_DN1414_c0_g2_i15.p2  ORF type:complete len:225 (+),score=41.84 TRINITY_DN1414_c0_g2_i15:1089-1763(+)
MIRIWQSRLLQLSNQSHKLQELSSAQQIFEGQQFAIQLKQQQQQQCQFSTRKKLGFTQDEYYEADDDDDDDDEKKQMSSKRALEKIEEDMLAEAPEKIQEQTRWQQKYGNMRVETIFPEGFRKLSLTRKLSKRRRVENMYRSERFKDVWWHLRFKQPGFGRDPWLINGYNHRFSGGVVSDMDGENYLQQYRKADKQVVKSKREQHKEREQKAKEALKKKKMEKR